MRLNKVSTSRKTLGEGAYQEIRNAIISLQLKPGQMISENELATSLGVSRTPIREALLMLNREALVEILPQRGARVAHINEHKVQEARFVRESLEVSAFTEVAKMWDKNDAHFQELHSSAVQFIEEQRKAIESGDVIGFLHADEMFHELILKQIDNQTLLEVVAEMRGHLNRMRYLELMELQHTDEVLRQHEALLAAIVANQAEQTRELLTKHLRRVNDDIPRIIAKYSEFFATYC